MVGLATKSANTVVHKGTPTPKAVDLWACYPFRGCETLRVQDSVPTIMLERFDKCEIASGPLIHKINKVRCGHARALAFHVMRDGDWVKL
jgi:hypothetical protein